MIPKEDALLKARPSPKYISSYLGLIYLKSLVGVRLLLPVYLMTVTIDLDGEKGQWKLD